MTVSERVTEPHRSAGEPEPGATAAAAVTVLTGLGPRWLNDAAATVTSTMARRLTCGSLARSGPGPRLSLIH